MKHAPREFALLDALEAMPAQTVQKTVWRVVREGRDACQCSASGGRWDDGTFDVLYTAIDPDGAVAEMLFHLKRGQPVMPSKVRYRLHALSVHVERVLDLSDPALLTGLGVDMTRYGQISYADRAVEYLRTQQISEAAHFLEFNGLLVPSARWPTQSLIIFCERAGPDAVEETEESGLIDWKDWQATRSPRTGDPTPLAHVETPITKGPASWRALARLVPGGGTPGPRRPHPTILTLGSRRLLARMAATAQLCSRVRTLSTRLASRIGTRAPRTIPPESASLI